jgi:ureidoglycolate hydrolase
MDFDADGATQLMTLSSWYQGLSFSMLERHFAVTQTFIATGGSPSVVALAPPGAVHDRDGVPEPEAVRAFIIDPGTGYLLHRGTWHSLDRFPLYPPASTFVVATTTETTDELQRAPSDRWTDATAGWSLTQMFDYQQHRGVSFRFVL